MDAQSCDDPPKLLILPEDRSAEARICTLAHPRTSNPSRYLFEPEKGIYEFTKVAAPKSTYRSWLIGGRARHVQPKAGLKSTNGTRSVERSQSAAFEASPSADIEHTTERPISDGYVIKTAELLVATPIDYLFLVLTSFTTSSSAKSPSSKRLFLSADDLLERVSEKSKHFNQILGHQKSRLAMEERMQAICDMVDAGDEKMYRLSDEKLLNELVLKGKAMVERGLPNTMEERFIRKALETPVMVLKRGESSMSEATPSQTGTPMSESTTSESIDSQTSTTTSDSTTSVGSAATEITVPDDTAPPPIPNELYHLLRMRTALSYMISSYIPPTLALALNTLLSSPQSPIDFKPLNERLASIAKIRAEALTSRSLGDFSRKRSMYEEDDAAETRAEKKRRKEEEEKKKKAGESRGIRDLKKVDTKGMKKMKDFFGKAAAVKKK
ncbi:hypothetical protein OEA41_010531 [Lepraria neglecta]|uniref:Ribonuclease H2 subunit B n=1 Tax=Lepraria neglecta TaxID=209136 RepID=A0AAD9YWT0_9LECA|nr:hypothetical protein OEA41_010531 [Lepraria neglecta]